MRKNTHFRFALLALVLVAFFFDASFAHAQTSSFESFLPSEDSLKTSNLAATLISALNIAAWIAFDLISDLLDPTTIFNGDSTSDLLMTLNKVWQLSRNLMNIIFAITLLVVAVYTVIKGDLEVVKAQYGRFVLAVVLVNFSWLFALMALDAANIMTTVVYGIPDQIETSGECKVPAGKNPDGSIKTKPCEIYTNIRYFLDPERAAGNGEDCEDNLQTMDQAINSCGMTCKFGFVCFKKEAWDADVKPSVKIIQGLVMNYARLGDIALVPSGQTVGTSPVEWTMFMVRILLAIFLMIAVAFPLIALVLAFVMRIPVLWLTIAFMPFWFAGWVLEGKVPGIEKTQEYTANQFIKAAFLPVTTAIPLTIGFIMMNALASQAWGTVELQTKLGSNLPLTGGIATYFDLLWMAMALGVMWVGTFEALSSAGGVFAAVGEKVRSTGQTIGKTLAMLPAFAPVLPGKTTPKQVMDAINPRRWENALKNSGTLQEALGKVRNPGPQLHLRSAQELQNNGGAARIGNSATAAVGATGAAAQAQAIRHLEETLEREHGIDIQSNQQMIDVLRDAQVKGAISPTQLSQLETMVAANRTNTP